MNAARFAPGLPLILALWLATGCDSARAVTLADLVGWWRSDLQYNGQRAEIYVRFIDDGGKAGVHFTLPPIQGWDFAAGGATIEGNRVQFNAVPLALTFDPDTRTLNGELPPQFAPAQRISVRFLKVATPTLPMQKPWSHAAPRTNWTYQADGPVWAGLAHDPDLNQLIVVTDRGAVIALDASNGKLRWTHATGGKVRARPVISAGSVYVNSDDGNLYRLEARTGQEQWRAMIDSRPAPRPERAVFDRYGSSALVREGSAYVGSVDGHLYALQESSGRQLWRAATKGKVYASPIASRDEILFGSFDGILYSVAAADGSARWQHDTRGAIATAPVLAGERVVVGNRAFELTGLDARNGHEAWRHFLFFSWVDSVPTHVGGKVFVGSSDTSSVMAFDAASGTQQWQSMLGGWCWAQPAVSGDRVYAGVAGGPTPVGPRRGALMALTRDTGQIVWAYELKPEGTAWGFAASPVAVGDAIYAADVQGKVYSFAEG